MQLNASQKMSQVSFINEVFAECEYPSSPLNTTKTHVVLHKDKSFASQVNTPNAIYEIKYDFNLNGDSIVIPEKSVLYIYGGNIRNGIIVGRDTEIFYVAGLLNCQLKGTFCNKSIQLEWFGIKSGRDNSGANDLIMNSYVLPSMENIGNTLVMKPGTEMYFSKPLSFNGTYDLDLRGRLRYSGVTLSTAISIGTPNTRVYGKNYFIHSLVSSNTTSFYSKGKIEENIGICLWNLKYCNITLDEVMCFGYCVRLCGNIGGCSSNSIHITRVGGRCYYGIHCCSYDTGWVNENTFYCKAIINYTDNPANDEMCAIWLDSRGTNTCNANVFYNPCVEGCHNIVRYNNALYNIIHDARAEHIDKAVLADTKSRNNTVYCKYWDRKGDYSSYGNNRVIKESEIIPPYVQIFSKQIGIANADYYGVCFGSGVLQAKGEVNGGLVFGKLVEIADKSKDANIEFVFEQPGRYAIVFLNDDYTYKSSVDLNTILLNSDITTVSIKGGIRGGSDTRRASVHISKDCGKMLIGTYSGNNLGNVVSMDVYSDNLIVDELYTVDKGAFSLQEDADIDIFYYENSTRNIFTTIEKVVINNSLELNNHSLCLANKELYIGKSGKISNGIIDISNTSIYPNYNALVEGRGLVVKGMPKAGTFYFQRGIPTWSDGKNWIDANGNIIKEGKDY